MFECVFVWYGVLLRDDLHCVADRILSVVWYEPENVVITGGVDCIRVWSLNSGQAVARMDTGRVATQVHTFVYALCVTKYAAVFATAVILSQYVLSYVTTIFYSFCNIISNNNCFMSLFTGQKNCRNMCSQVPLTLHCQ